MDTNEQNNNPFLHMLKSYDEAIAHYDFVIQDLSSEIYDSALQRTKLPVINFLKTLREQWVLCRDDLAKQIEQM